MWSVAKQGLTPQQQQKLADAMVSRQFEPRSLLYREGGPCTHLSIVDIGRVRSYYASLGGKEFTNVVSGQGTMLGLISIVLDVPVVISVESIDAVTVSQIPTAKLLALMEAVPLLAFNFNRVLASGYIDCIARGRRNVDSAPVRLAKVLCRLTHLEVESKAGEGEIHGITQEDLAAMIDTTRSWVAQILGSFEDQGLITYRRGVIHVPDVAQLQLLVARYEEQGNRPPSHVERSD